jgi:hypothetical protein
MTWDMASAIAQVASDLNSLNAIFSTDAVLRAAFRKAFHGATRANLQPDEQTALDGHLISVTNICEQLAREVATLG